MEFASLQSKGVAESSPVLDTQHPGAAGSASPVARTSLGILSPGTGAKPGLRQQRKHPPSSTHPFKDLNKAQRLQEHTEVHPQAHHHRREQGRQQEPGPAPASCCSTPSTALYGQPLPHPSPGEGDGPTHRHSAGALQPQASSGGWGNDAVAVTRGNSTGHFV